MHVSGPGLVVDVAAADDVTALAFQELLGDRWTMATAVHTARDVGRPRCSAALLHGPAQQLTPDSVAGPAVETPTTRP
ncbi:DUF6207 family protein [Streptomyces sp. NPDC057806]|uniref:DUF6207 family protein n=1 Tax=Streptomyces sp. NPDC057806 TaxID=3346255 RepID=UPI00367F30C1